MADETKAERDYRLARCANYDCPNPDGNLTGDKPGAAKIGVRPDVQIKRGAKRFRIYLCSPCYKEFSAVPEGYGRRAK